MGGKLIDERLIRQFRKVLKITSLYDSGCKRNGFTWSNRHSNATFTKERLDRVLANNIWKKLFKSYGVESMTTRSSDHKPILMSIKLNNHFLRKKSFSIQI